MASIKRLYEDIVHKSSQRFGSVEVGKKMLEHIAQVNQVSLFDELYHFRSLITEQDLENVQNPDGKSVLIVLNSSRQRRHLHRGASTEPQL